MDNKIVNWIIFVRPMVLPVTMIRGKGESFQNERYGITHSLKTLTLSHVSHGIQNRFPNFDLVSRAKNEILKKKPEFLSFGL